VRRPREEGLAETDLDLNLGRGGSARLLFVSDPCDDEELASFSPELRRDLRAIIDAGPSEAGREATMAELQSLQARFTADLTRRGMTPDELSRAVFEYLHPGRDLLR